ncbi:thioredoxin family protein [Pseudomonas fluvialis]|jgi:small redox-active disulfide protein 2|uniref:Thioredoxin family protein n=1 Tax=Pseudomonas fluvialis TaxID=1793966 RepID=A0A2I0CLQ4_9PSED|nr:thioredoxin family protein [Pseudomonas pharmacofabricae]PKF70078.1 thioredoxin family protein [Pseudomonas pharmacofabricae]
MHIKILGPGCKKCQLLLENTQQALATLGMDASIEKVSDYAAIAALGVMSTPALVINERVVASGRVLDSQEIAHLLQQA